MTQRSTDRLGHPCVAIFTFERPLLLLNCVASVRRFLPSAQVLVVDDGSRSELQLRLLRRLAPWCDVRRRDRVEGERHGGLYEAMNDTLRDLVGSAAGSVVLLQDDMQLVRDAAEPIHDTLQLMATHPKTHMAGVAFDKWMYSSERKPCADCRCVFLRRGLFDVGLLKLDGSNPPTFGPTESAANLAALDAGFRAIMATEPFVAFVPWPTRYRHGERAKGWQPVWGRSGLVQQLDRFLDDDGMHLDDLNLMLTARSPIFSTLADGTTRAFAEGCVEPHGWAALSPYGYGEPWSFHLKHWLRNMIKNDGRPRLLPRLVGTRGHDHLRPSELRRAAGG